MDNGFEFYEWCVSGTDHREFQLSSAFYSGNIPRLY